MTIARIIADWMDARIQDAGTPAAIRAIAKSVATGDTKDPEKVSVSWEEVDVDPVAPPLHIYDLEYTIKTPTNSDIPMSSHREVKEWLEDQFDVAAFTVLKANVLADTGDDLQSWFFGKTETDNEKEDHQTVQAVRLAIVRA